LAGIPLKQSCFDLTRNAKRPTEEESLDVFSIPASDFCASGVHPQGAAFVRRRGRGGGGTR